MAEGILKLPAATLADMNRLAEQIGEGRVVPSFRHKEALCHLVRREHRLTIEVMQSYDCMAEVSLADGAYITGEMEVAGFQSGPDKENVATCCTDIGPGIEEEQLTAFVTAAVAFWSAILLRSKEVTAEGILQLPAATLAAMTGLAEQISNGVAPMFTQGELSVRLIRTFRRGNGNLWEVNCPRIHIYGDKPVGGGDNHRRMAKVFLTGGRYITGRMNITDENVPDWSNADVDPFFPGVEKERLTDLVVDAVAFWTAEATS